MEQNPSAQGAQQDADQERRTTYWGRIGHAFLIGLLIGIAVYGTVNKGFGVFTLLPLGIIYLLLRNNKRSMTGNKDQGPPDQ